MKALILSIFLSLSVYAIEIAPTNFGLRDLATMVSQECGKNILISQDVKNMSADYFVIQDISPAILFSTFKGIIESKGLFLNEYDGFYIVDDKKLELPPDEKNLSNVELTMKIIEINNEKIKNVGFNSALTSKLSLSGVTDFKKLSFDKLFSADFESVLTDLETQDYLKIMSEPYVVVANGETTKLNVGDTISVKTSSYATDSTSTTAALRNTYTQKELGLTIEVSPKIQKNGLILLKTTLTNETLKKKGDDGLIETKKKSISGNFNIKDGGSVSIGGLTASSDVKSTSKVPLLGDIPVLSYVFSYDSTDTVRTTLTLFIEVRIIK
ncbi:type II secretion system protein GspD [Sulfurospirillum diekertiae]|uniref:Type II secretion system protein D n=1 Tax=Sulfurospirillum diekertiae TaxID=1854492 RepID=A0A1Y0HMT2_9BACT|nr:type II and III secretion system protein [Sulfurospirillum diekertiae]ARU49408.1 Putative type II secretion system protein D [Sulfurospirillum diekertiae]ASC94215.1 Putative type II secretion system protein D [Sulfurospirillum diekertiae]